MASTEPVTLAVVHLGPQHVPTGFTQHLYGVPGDAVPVPPPASLRIERFPGEDGFLLLCFDGKGDELTDTYHDSVEAAKEQARREFNVEPGEWQDA